MTTTIPPNHTSGNHSFDTVAASFLQADGLPFADVLTAERDKGQRGRTKGDRLLFKPTV